MSDRSGGGGPPKWVPEPRQQVRDEHAPDAGRPPVQGDGVGGYGAAGYPLPGAAAHEPGVEELGAQPSASGPDGRTQVDEPVALGPGALLAAERSAQGLAVGDIARQLKLSARQVEALERDDYDAFAGMVFVRGFLRNYAKLLDVDPEPLVAMTYASGAEPPPMAPLPVVEQTAAARVAGPGRGWLLGAVVLIALVVAAIFEGRQREAPRVVFEPAPAPGSAQSAESPPPQREAARNALELAPPAPAPGSPQHAESPPPAAGAPATVDPVPTAVVAAPAASPAAEEAAPAAVEPATAVSPDAPAAADEKPLRLAFDGASWVEVKDSAGAVIFSQLNEAGTEQIVRGRAPLSVVIGNAHNVRLSYGDRSVDLGPHTNVDVARLVLE